jgi:threonine dehydratase
VIAASAGNHAQGVALAASILGIRATVVMPENVQLPKLIATRAYGAEVVLHGANITEALARAAEIAERAGSTLIHPFEHADIIAGQGTVGLEITEQCAQARTVVVPAGGGGLLAGIAIAVHGAHASATAPAPAVIGVQAAAVAPFPASLAAGHPVGVTAAPTMADGIAVAVPGAITFQIIQELVGQMLTVTEENLSRALLTCLERGKQLVEPAGAAGVAALLEHPGAVEPPVVVVLSGGNIDPLLLSRVLRYGLAAAGRYLAVRCRIPDVPGSLAVLLTEIGALGASVLDVVHERVSVGLRIDEVEVTLQLETRGPDHREVIVTALAEAGYSLQFI